MKRVVYPIEIHLKLGDRLATKLDIEAMRAGTTRSDLIRQVLNQWWANLDSARIGAAVER